MAGMFDTQAEGLDKTAAQSEQKSATKTAEGGEDPKSKADVEQFNQHILLTAQAVNRLRTNLFTGG